VVIGMVQREHIQLWRYVLYLEKLVVEKVPCEVLPLLNWLIGRLYMPQPLIARCKEVSYE